jgi:hypothetical protein
MCFLFVESTGIRTHGLTLARQTLYQPYYLLMHWCIAMEFLTDRQNVNSGL